MNPIWEKYQNATEARIGLGRAGGSLPTKHFLQLKMDHAFARSAVWAPCDWDPLFGAIEKSGRSKVLLQSEAGDRNSYLLNPHKGKTLSLQSKNELKNAPSNVVGLKAGELVVCFVDGLSSTAISKNASSLYKALEPILAGYALTQIFCIQNGRVAIGDELAEITQAKSVLVCIGERPGLSSADSLSLYYTYGAKVGNTDETRNCISNVRPGGLSFETAVAKAEFLIKESRLQQMSGVMLKDRTDLSLLAKPKEPGGEGLQSQSIV